MSRKANPWLHIPFEDYSSHMGPRVADQLSALSHHFGALYCSLHPQRLAVLGCAGGNGFEHIDAATTTMVLGVDINQSYLNHAASRFPHLAAILDLRCESAETLQLQDSSFDLVYCGLLLEYLDSAALIPRIVSSLSPRGHLSVVLQLPSTTAMVTPTPYRSLHQLEGFMSLVDPAEVRTLATAAGLTVVEEREIPLAHGKRFHSALFSK